VDLEPGVEGVVGLEVEELLKDGQAEDLAVVDLGRRTAARDELAVLGDDAGLGEGVVEGAVDAGDEVFQTERGGDRGGGHGRTPFCPPEHGFSGILIGDNSLQLERLRKQKLEQGTTILLGAAT
jgi:hypothetical protein